MAFEAQPELFSGDFLGDLGRPAAVDLDLEQVEDVAVQDQLDFTVRAGLRLVVRNHLSEAVILEEVAIRELNQ